MGQNTSNSFEQVSTTFRATLVSVTKQNAELRERIVEAKLEQGRENNRNLVLNAVIKDALEENKALQNELQRLKSQNTKDSKLEGKKCVTKENKTPEHRRLDVGSVEMERVFEKAEQEIALISGKISNLQEQYEGLEKCDQLKARTRNYEIFQAKFRKLQEAIEILRGQTDNLKERFESLRPIQQVQRERFLKIDAEREALFNERLELDKQYFILVKEIARESHYSKRSEVMQLTNKAVGREIERRKEHLKDLTEEYDALKIRQFEYKQKVLGMEELKTDNDRLRQKIDNMESKFINIKANKMSFMHIDNEEVTIKAVNKKLLKKKQKLEKELQKFENCEVKIQEMKHGMSELRNENCNLYKDVVRLEVQIKQIGLLKAHWKSLKKEKESLELSNKNLKLEIVKLNWVNKTGFVTNAIIRNNELTDQIIEMQRISRKLHEQYEDTLVNVYRPPKIEINYQQIRERLRKEGAFNCKYALEISKMKEIANINAGPSTSG